MFNNLIESKAKKSKSAGGTVMSVVIHSVVALAAMKKILVDCQLAAGTSMNFTNGRGSAGGP